MESNWRVVGELLGGIKVPKLANGDANNLTAGKVYIATGPNLPRDYVIIDTQINVENDINQTAYGVTSSEIYTRSKTGNTWTAWSRCDNVGLVSNTDPNTLPTFSVCYCVNQANAPTNYFFCFTLYNSTDGAQIGVSTSGDFYSRSKENGTWTAWKKAVF